MNLIYHSKLVRLICLLVLLSLAGCETTKIKYIESEDFPKDRVYRLKTVYFKDGHTMDLTGKDAKFKRSFKGMQNVIVFNYGESFIELKDIDKLKIEVVESDTTKSVLVIVGAVILFFLILLLIFGFEAAGPH